MCIRDRYQRRVHGTPIVRCRRECGKDIGKGGKDIKMGLFIALLMVFEWVWCVLMPIVGSLYLIARKYHQENAPKENLFRHWCYYWIIYFVLRLVARILDIFLFKLSIIFYIIRVIILCVIVTPRLDLTTNITEKVLGRSDELSKFRDKCIAIFNKKVLHRDDKKTE
eukprot:TRINITY_DN712_c0_g1_i20.p1 TRINITY_DN712_c0_g1~~TRINITY_DN712_c0_g1_i20.p1  ORF type:complete len:182 (-),score=33.25 TRINITY_DN712_c0_g1_i20:64-564(-)